MSKQQKRKEQIKTGFNRDPYMFVKNLFAKEKSRILKVPVSELEEHPRKTYSDIQRYEPISIMDDMPPVHPPEHHMNKRPPTWNEFESTVK